MGRRKSWWYGLQEFCNTKRFGEIVVYLSRDCQQPGILLPGCLLQQLQCWRVTYCWWFLPLIKHESYTDVTCETESLNYREHLNLSVIFVVSVDYNPKDTYPHRESQDVNPWLSHSKQINEQTQTDHEPLIKEQLKTRSFVLFLSMDYCGCFVPTLRFPPLNPNNGWGHTSLNY